MWDPPRPGLEPVSPALAGRFSTTAPPGKPTTSKIRCTYKIRKTKIVLDKTEATKNNLGEIILNPQNNISDNNGLAIMGCGNTMLLFQDMYVCNLGQGATNQHFGIPNPLVDTMRVALGPSLTSDSDPQTLRGDKRVPVGLRSHQRRNQELCAYLGGGCWQKSLFVSSL